MIQGRDGPRLLLEAVTMRPFQNLNRDNTAQSGIGCPVYLAHAARADGRKDLIRSQTYASGKGHGC
jgi:hypothetical protein